jgi:multicomponent Na+:H+ antiporter subunit E
VRGLRVSGMLVWLATLWVLFWDDLSTANVLSGIAVGFAVLAFAHLPGVGHVDADSRPRVRPLSTAYLAIYVLYKLVEANLILAWEIVTPKNRINVGVVAVPLRTDSQISMMVVANIITLTPGTVTIESVGTPPVLYVNVLHLDELEKVRRDLLRVEELCVRAFGSRRDRAQLAGEVATS